MHSDSRRETLPDILTTEQVAQLFQVSSQTVRKNPEHFGAIRLSQRIVRYPKTKVELILGGVIC